MVSPSHRTSDSLILLRLSGDISTKSRRTRLSFIQQLRRNLADALESTGFSHRIHGGWSRLYIETRHPQPVPLLARVFGIQSLSVARRRGWQDLEDLVATGTELFRDQVKGRRFAVRARRGSERDRIPFRSQDIERKLGAALLPHALKVDLDHPEVTVRVEVERSQAYFFSEQVPAHGGLPLGVEGRALALVSGGFDSAVASWLMLKRGVYLDYLFFNLGGEIHERGALQVMKTVAERWSYGYHPRLWAVDLRPMVEKLQSVARPRNWQVLLKRLMFRGAHELAGRAGASALVTGEAVGQVSSQTLQNLAVISRATTLPVLRPLVGFNKDEIVDYCRKIGTFDLSAAVPEYCALDARPTTQASERDVAADEAKLELGRLDEALSQAVVYDLRTLNLDRRNDWTVDAIPDGATVIDLRSRHAFEAWHYPGAVRLDYLDALARAGSFARNRTYIVCCEVDFKSATLAERMRQGGLEAYCFTDGLKGLLRYATDQGLAAKELIAPVTMEN